MSLPSNQFAHLQVPLEDILSATNNFDEENTIRKSGFAKEYKGQLLWSGELIDISARRLDHHCKEVEHQFWMEVSLLSTLKHKNLVSLIGFCDENDEKIIINKLETRLSLSRYLSDPMLLTWVRRLEISLGIAQALSYIYYDESRDFSVIHRFICSATVVLNDDWEPKLCDFQFSTKIKASQRHHSFHTIRLEYVDGYEIAYDCLSEERSQRPNIHEVVTRLESALKLQMERQNAEHSVVVAEVENTSSNHDEGSLTSISTQVESHVSKETKSYDLSQLKLSFQDIESVPNNCADENIIRKSKGEANESLNEHLDDQTFTWMQRLKICGGVAKALSYIHYDVVRDFSVIHCNVKSSKILLDDDWEPKLSGFELALKNTVARRHRLILTRDVMENIYMDPKYKKSGVPLNEALGQGLLSQLSNSYLYDMMDKHLQNQMDGEALKIFSETAYCCIKEERADRPHIDQVVKGIETALKLQLVYENRELQRNAVDGTSSYHLMWNNFEHLKIGLNDIEMATEMFADKYCIGSGGFGMEVKIADFGLSKFHPADQDASTSNASMIAGTPMYFDLEYEKSGKLNKKSDIYSFGVVLFEILTGRLAYDFDKGIAPIARHHFAPIARHHFEKGTLMEIVDCKIKEETDKHVFSLSKRPDKESLDIFSEIAFRCLAESQVQRPTIDVVINELKRALKERRPTSQEVVIHLKKAMEFQEDYEKWEPKLPKDYKEIIQLSKCPEIYSTIQKEDLYKIFSKGIILQQDKVLLSFDGDRERNEMVSATVFLHRFVWFEIVAEILDFFNLFIEIKTRAHFLSPNVVYGVYLVFKFCDSRNFSSKPVFVNLKYRNGHESMHAYFAIWRDEQWMIIELHCFSNPNDDVVFEFLLESFSSYYCGDAAVYVEGIKFRAIEKVKHEEIGKLKEVQQVMKSDFNVDQVQHLPTNFGEIFKVRRNYDKLFWLGEVDGKKLLVLLTMVALYKFTNVKTLTSKPPAQPRPEPTNIHDITLVPKQRKDGCMEIQLRKFNSTHKFKDDSLSMNMRFTCLEGTMSCLIEEISMRAVIRPAMLYGSECWPITKALAFRVEVTELRMLRWTCGKTMIDMISNGVFKAALDVDSIIDKIREGSLRWFGHVKRRPQSASVRRVEAMVVEGSRRRGRPRLRWEDRLKMDKKELRLSEDMTYDRNALRDRIRISR
nr:protein kinase-like domain, phloem protein 2-like protein [Tanacetum cinerariifolium]